ncbi:Spc98 family-domain-containing protein [Catenaria anguillulae PL171]|uniref:Spindle pole body component n=1 Tax=Catenaria anguillulae PL171 TaxID=765915 RepID=A0A1Y2HL53_9FUNG|nr:Spc98 family-domain-containing protein [Catenaria anguillulae PL171]
MLHELLVSMTGVPTDIFVPFPPHPLTPTTFIVRSDFPHLHPAERASLNRLAQLGFWAKKLASFVHSESLPPGSIGTRPSAAGLYSHGFAQGIRAVLDQYLETVDQTETDLLSAHARPHAMPLNDIDSDRLMAGVDADGMPRTPLSSLLVTFSVPSLVLESTLRLVDEFTSNRDAYFGSKLLDLILPRILDGREPVAKAMRMIAHAVLRVFFKHLSGYLLHATAFDPKNEFFVQPVTQEDSPTASDSRLRDQFTFEPSLVPSTLISSQLAETIVFTVTSSYIVQKSARHAELVTPDMWQNQLQILARLLDLQTDLRPLDLELAMDLIRRDYTNALWQIMVLDEKLLDYLNAIRNVFLGGNLDLLRHFLTRVAHLERKSTLGHSSFGISERELNFLLQSTYSQVVARTAADASSPDALLMKQFRFSWSAMDTSAAQPMDTDRRTEYLPFRNLAAPSSTSSSSQSRSIPNPTTLHLTLSIPWPLSLIVTPPHLSAYNATYQALAHVHRVQLRLHHLHFILRDASTDTKRNPPLGPVAMLAQVAATYRAELVATLAGISDAMSAVIESETRALVKDIQEMAAHDDDDQVVVPGSAVQHQHAKLATVADWHARHDAYVHGVQAAVLLYPHTSTRSLRESVVKLLDLADTFAGVVEAGVGEQVQRRWRRVDEMGDKMGRVVAGDRERVQGFGLVGVPGDKGATRSLDEWQVLVGQAAAEFHQEAKFLHRMLVAARASGAQIVQEMLIRLDYNKHWSLGPLRLAGGKTAVHVDEHDDPMGSDLSDTDGGDDLVGRGPRGAYANGGNDDAARARRWEVLEDTWMSGVNRGGEQHLPTY